jgi:hypothetical protein
MRFEIIDLITDQVIKSFTNRDKAFDFQAKLEDETECCFGLREVPDDV